MRHTLNHAKQYQYLQHPILWVTLKLVQTIINIEDQVQKSAVATSFQVGWIDCTFQDIVCQKL